jgi:hypothetical protein
MIVTGFAPVFAYPRNGRAIRGEDTSMIAILVSLAILTVVLLAESFYHHSRVPVGRV